MRRLFLEINSVTKLFAISHCDIQLVANKIEFNTERIDHFCKENSFLTHHTQVEWRAHCWFFWATPNGGFAAFYHERTTVSV